jgi:hypothetical protein
MLGNGNYHFECGRNHLATLSLFYDGIEEPLRKLMARVLRKWVFRGSVDPAELFSGTETGTKIGHSRFKLLDGARERVRLGVQRSKRK